MFCQQIDFEMAIIAELAKLSLTALYLYVMHKVVETNI